MKSVLSSLSAVLAGVFFLASPAMADVVYTPTLHSDYQAVYEDGTPLWPGTNKSPYPISLVGVVINDPADMLDYSVTASSPKWQVFIQATDAAVASGDFGGTALYMMRDNYGDGSQYYTYAEWLSELARMGGLALQYGDVVRVDAKAPGMDYRGKYNVNEKHKKSSDYDFSVTILGAATPTAAPITLAELKDADDNFIFDETRQTGCEHYQGSLVHLDGLLLLDADDWALDGTVVVKQGNLTFDVKLGLDDGLAAIDAELLKSTPFSITAILDQEDGNDSYFTEGYRLWLTNASNLTVAPEPGSLALLVAGGLATLLLWRRSLSRGRWSRVWCYDGM